MRTRCASALLWLPLAGCLGAQQPNEFFAMDTAMVQKLGTLLERADVETLAALGYRGVAPIAWDKTTWAHLTKTLIPLLDEKKLKMYAVYSGVSADRDTTVLDVSLEMDLAALKGRGTIIWLPVTSEVFKPSDPAGDVRAVAWL